MRHNTYARNNYNLYIEPGKLTAVAVDSLGNKEAPYEKILERTSPVAIYAILDRLIEDLTLKVRDKLTNSLI